MGGLGFLSIFGPTLCLRAQVVLRASLKMLFRIFANSRGSAGLLCGSYEFWIAVSLFGLIYSDKVDFI